MTAQQFRKKAVVIEAVQFVAPVDDDEGNWREIKAWGAPVMRPAEWKDGEHNLLVVTLEGQMTASPGDWIIKGIAGEFYPCKPDIFDGTYDRVLSDDELPGAGDELTAFAEALAQFGEPTPWSYDGPRVREPLQVEEDHIVDEVGRPAGGHSVGVGFDIAWQNGPLVDPITNERRPQTGAFVEAIVQAAIGRIEHYQASMFSCQENADALDHLYAALDRLNDRTRARVERGVEGTHQP